MNNEMEPGIAHGNEALSAFTNLRIEQVALITGTRGRQHVLLVGHDWHGRIDRCLDEARQPQLDVTFQAVHQDLTETVDLQVVRFPDLEQKCIQNVQLQQIDAVPTVVVTLADDFRVLFSASIDDESIGVEFADPAAAVE